MKTRWQELRSKHWSKRPIQERRVIAIVSVLLLPIVYYYLLWQPAHHAVSKLHETLPILQAQDVKLSAQASEVDSLRHRPELTALDAQALKSSVIESATRHQLRASISSMEIQEPNGVRISCDAISFATLLVWLRELEQEQHIRADAISISSMPQAGIVKVNATLINGKSL